MAFKRANRAKVGTSTTGTGTITLGTTIGGFQSFADAGIADGDTVRYVIEEGFAWEIGLGTYSSTGPTLTRDTIYESSNSGAALNLGGTATVYATVSKEDFADESALFFDQQELVGDGGA